MRPEPPEDVCSCHKEPIQERAPPRLLGRSQADVFSRNKIPLFLFSSTSLLQMSLFIVESAQLVYSFEAIYKQIGISVPGPILPSRTAAERTNRLYEGFLLGALASPASRPAVCSHLPFLYSSFGPVETRSTDSGKPSPLGALGGRVITHLC